jgi:glutaredoxin
MRRLSNPITSARAQRGSQRGYALVACVFFAVLAFSAGDLGAEEGRVFYKYTDAAGQLHIVQSLDRVPTQYRNQIGKIALEGEPLWTKSTAQMPAPRPREEFKPVKRRVLGRNSDVVLYYADWCGYCKKARRWLDERNVVYDLRDIDIPRYGKELAEVSGGKSIPVLSIGGELVRGFNPKAYERALGS